MWNEKYIQLHEGKHDLNALNQVNFEVNTVFEKALMLIQWKVFFHQKGVVLQNSHF